MTLPIFYKKHLTCEVKINYVIMPTTPQALDKGANQIAFLISICVGLPDYFPKLLSNKVCINFGVWQPCLVMEAKRTGGVYKGDAQASLLIYLLVASFFS